MSKSDRDDESPRVSIRPTFGGGMRRRRLRWPLLVLFLLIAAVAAVALLVLRDDDGGEPSAALAGAAIAVPGAGAPERDGREALAPTLPREPTAQARRFALEPVASPTPVRVRYRDMPRAGVLFDIDTGEVLWRYSSQRRLRIASLTKMMTALIIAEEHEPAEKVRISRAAAKQAGSQVGLLPVYKRVRLEALLAGLLLVSGNDAAVALAEHNAGSVRAFVARMNARARELGLRCTRFSTPNGLRDRGNFSCARDLAVLARVNLANPRIARLAGRRQAVYPFPTKGGRLFLTNNNPLMRAGEEMTGLKTGYTRAAGRCYAMTARRGGRHLGVVLLDSPDPVRQVKSLLRRGARA